MMALRDTNGGSNGITILVTDFSSYGRKKYMSYSSTIMPAILWFLAYAISLIYMTSRTVEK